MTKTLKAKFSRVNDYIFEKREVLLYFSWIISIVGMLGSLIYSEILKLPPCKLCWFQRIALYPMVFLFPVGISLRDKNLPYYILPLSVSGLMISFYHVLLYEGFVPEAPQACEVGLSCTTQYVEILGFLSIPLLSFIAFILINLFVSYFIILNRKS